MVAGPPWALGSTGGLRAVVVDGGAPASLGTDSLELVQHAASAFEPGLLQLWLRDRKAGRCWPMLGAGSGGAVHVADGALVVHGRTDTSSAAGTEADGRLVWQATLTLSPARSAWAWHVEVVNEGETARDVDVVHAHDVALAAPGALRTNELYVSQYLDVTPLHGEGFGTALAVRQNLAQHGTTPWCVLAATTPVVAWATDALDVHGWSARTGDAPHGLADDLPSRRRQHEHTLATLQTAPTRLAPGDRLRTSFAGLLVEDHPASTSDADLHLVHEAIDLARVAEPWSAAAATPAPAPAAGRPAPSGPFDGGRELRTRPLTEDELRTRWPGAWQAVERDVHGALLSFFTGSAGPGDPDEHVVTPAKEAMTLRPHGTILRTGDTAAPDPRGLTVTAWMTGSPLSYLTSGNASTTSVLTTVRGYLGLHRAYGLRVLVEVAGAWRLLDMPSVFSMTPDGACWTYAFDRSTDGADDPGGVVEVRTVAPAADHRVDLEVRVTSGPRRRVLLTLHLATPTDPLPAPTDAPHRTEQRADGVVVHLGDGGRRLVLQTTSALVVGDDAPLFDDARARSSAVVTLVGDAAPALGLRLTVERPGRAATARGDEDATPDWWSTVTALRVDHGPEAEALAVSLPWLVRDAFVHFLSPRGLEQYSGGAWGTRDVAQGPLELLLALDRHDDARALLVTIFTAQNPDGTWPQAFGFLPGDEDFRMEPPHGDVVHWPVLALGRYLLASGDPTLLDEAVPWFTPSGEAPVPPSSLRRHVERALDRARSGVLPGTRLVAYGHGDWNDSLQPADPTMARTMASAWTVTLHHQALRTLADGLGTLPGEGDLADALREEAAAVAADLHRYLVVDGELAGYVQLDAPDDTDPQPRVRRLLVHPRDAETGLRHGSLQMIHALGDDLFDPDQAAHHVALVREHLMGVDGVRLFDRPPPYSGGLMRNFQRAETATFVGREIGLMYVHAHLRWCEAMARWGDADALWLGLRQVLPPAAVDVVPGAARRQANAYPSSSDAAVLDRADFAARYADVLTGATGLEGGWRIYSSGPGVLLRIVVQSVLGIRRRGRTVEIDPVLPQVLDDLTAAVPLAGGLLRVRYRVGTRGHGPTEVRLAGRTLEAARAPNPYRPGALVIDLDALDGALRPGAAELEVHVP